MVLSMGGFFSLMAIGLANSLPSAMYNGLTSLGVNTAAAQTISETPPVGTLFAAFLGANPIQQLMLAVDPTQLQPGGGADVATLTGQSFFPTLISGPFKDGLTVAFSVSIAMLLIAAVASLFRGKRFVHPGDGVPNVPADQPVHEASCRRWPGRARRSSTRPRRARIWSTKMRSPTGGMRPGRRLCDRRIYWPYIRQIGEPMSKTLIDIDDELLDRARQLIGPNATKRDAVNTALSRFVRLHAQREAVDWIADNDPVADLRDPDVKAAARR